MVVIPDRREGEKLFTADTEDAIVSDALFDALNIMIIQGHNYYSAPNFGRRSSSGGKWGGTIPLPPVLINLRRCNSKIPS
jgi:hypothetical protein